MKILNKILDALLKIVQIVCLPMGSYLTYLGITHKTYVIDHAKGYGVLKVSDPVLIWIIVGIVLVAIGSFVIGLKLRRKE